MPSFRPPTIVTVDPQHYDWLTHARPEQLPPSGDWSVWLILAGRGFGKTRTGAETLRMWIEEGLYKRVALLAKTERDARQVMIEGQSGILSICPEDERPFYAPSQNRVYWKNGAVATCYSADTYNQLRGPQFDAAWVDELAKFRHPTEAWEQLLFSLRLGPHPRIIVTTTPRPIPLIKELLEDPKVVVTRGSTFDNAANLSPRFLKMMESKFGNTTLGAQELYGEIIESIDGALWSYELLARCRGKLPDSFQRLVVAVDPALSDRASSDETGIIVVGLGYDKCAYVIEDHSGRYSSTEWAHRVVNAYQHHKADRVVAEVNAGGDLVESMLRIIDPTISYKAVRAKRGKVIRAEPIAALYEQGRVVHGPHNLSDLERQMCTYVPGKSFFSPDRMDALVWGLTELMMKQSGSNNLIWNN